MAIEQQGADVSIVEFVMSHIREEIRSGKFAVGNRIIEAELRRNLGVSRGSIREAVSRLVAEGLLEANLHKGASVRALSPKEIGDLLEIREVVEGLAARKAASRIDMTDYAERLRLAQKRLDAAEDNADDPDAYFQANTDYHSLLLEIGGNTRLPAILHHLYTTFFRAQAGRLMSHASVRRSNDDHRRITDAILRGDTGLAEMLMRSHLQRTAYSLAQRPQDR
ncbi:GntR family transcriptional regulator [Paraburkholderia sp.]|uniref:GntR family transcriptional regulator n=1 Tax=Paraburkholderia sp. TaxID=1926495 RepID=UPI003D6FC579